MAKRLYVSNKDESARLFKSDFIELFSKVHWSVPLFLYLPLVIYFIYDAFAKAELSLLMIGGYFLLGIVVWSITEYVMHRWVFHFEPKSEFGQKIHFIFHGVHHDYPNDSKRLVMPPAVSIPLAVLFYFLFLWILGPVSVGSFFAGFLLSYLFYDMLHYSVHHVNSNAKWFLALKTHHLKHHFKDPEAGYGVSSPVWDHIIGSTFSANKEQKKQ